jgi:hypothetical protein
MKLGDQLLSGGGGNNATKLGPFQSASLSFWVLQICREASRDIFAAALLCLSQGGCTLTCFPCRLCAGLCSHTDNTYTRVNALLGETGQAMGLDEAGNTKGMYGFTLTVLCPAVRCEAGIPVNNWAADPYILCLP